MRAYACARVISLKPLSLLIVLFCNIRITFYGVLKENSALFRDFFTLWHYISPYTNRRCCKMRFAPPHHSFLLSRESQSNIQNSYVSPYYPNFSQAFFEKREEARVKGLLLSVFAREKKRKLLSLQYE